MIPVACIKNPLPNPSGLSSTSFVVTTTYSAADPIDQCCLVILIGKLLLRNLTGRSVSLLELNIAVPQVDDARCEPFRFAAREDRPGSSRPLEHGQSIITTARLADCQNNRRSPNHPSFQVPHGISPNFVTTNSEPLRVPPPLCR